MNSKMILILVIAVFFSGVLVPVFADTTGACGIEKKEIIKSIIGYITQKSDINQGQVMVLIRGYLGSVNCGSTDLVEARQKADNIDDDVIPSCSDGTLFAHCSYDKPKYCYSGKLLDRCDLCCDSGRCTSDGQCESEMKIIDCTDVYGSGFFCGTYSDWEEECHSVGQIKEISYDRCSDTIDGAQYCIKCEKPQEIIDCVQRYGDDYWCSTYDEWEKECQGSGEAVDLANARCYEAGGVFKGYCSTCRSDEPDCHVHENPSWLEVNDYDILVVEKGCIGSFGTEYLVELREKATPVDIGHCGERVWVWLEHGLNPLESGKCYRVKINADTVSGHVITGVGDEKSCPVCENTDCHTHENPAWIDDGTHKIKIVGIGCTQAGCAEGNGNGTEVLIELREGAFCGEQVWIWLDTMMSTNMPDIGSCYNAEIFTEMYGSNCGAVVRYLMNQVECSSAETYTFALHAGWNMVSFPVIPSDGSVAEIFGPIEGSMSVVWAYDASDTADPWKKYDSSVPFGNDLLTISPGVGYIVLMNTSADLVVSGKSVSLTANDIDSKLVAGSNLVGPGSSNIVLDAKVGKWRYDGNSAYVTSGTLEVGKGYWLSCGSTEAKCTDGLDDDCDGLVDSADSDCGDLSCHTHTNPAWLETNDYDIQVIEKGCTDSFGTEYLVEIREKLTPVGIEYCGERLWIWRSPGSALLEQSKCYRVMINTDTVSGHVITGVGDEKSCPVCENTDCHTHENPAWIDDGTHKIKIVGIGCTQAGCAEGNGNGTEVLIELREGAFCGEQVWVWLDTMMSTNMPDIGSCYNAEIFTEMYGPNCGHVIRYLFSHIDCPDCEGNVTG